MLTKEEESDSRWIKLMIVSSWKAIKERGSLDNNLSGAKNRNKVRLEGLFRRSYKEEGKVLVPARDNVNRMVVLGRL